MGRSVLLRTSPSSRLRVVLGVLFVALFIAARLAFIHADPPRTLPSGYYASELFAEPPAKSHEARNFALFGAWQTNPVDNYQFWRAQSPAWVYPLAYFYRLFGVSYGSLRAFSTLSSAITIAALLALLRRCTTLVAYVAFGLFVAASYVGLHYERVGLLEPAVGSIIALVALCLLFARKNVLWLLPAQWAFALAILTKQTGAFALPMMLLFGIPALLRGARAGERKRLYQALIVGHALLLAGALLAYASTDAYMRTIAWNFGHVVHGEDGATSIDAAGVDASEVAATLGDGIKLWRFFSTYPIVGSFATLESVRLLLRLAKRRYVAPWRKIALVWLISGAVTLLATKLTDVRFYMLVGPPVALLGASFVETLVRSRIVREKGYRKLLAVGATVGFFVGQNLFLYVAWTFERTYEIDEVAGRLRAIVGDRPAVIIGLWSAPIVLSTPYDHFYVKNDFNASADALRALGPTHFLLKEKGDYTRTILEREFPGYLATLTPVERYEVRSKPLALYVLPAPIGEKPPKPRPKLDLLKMPILR